MAKKTELKERTTKETLYPVNLKECVLDLKDATVTESGLMSKEDKQNLDTIYEGDKPLVTPVISSTWTIKNQNGTAATIAGLNTSANSIIVETGYKVEYAGKFKWTHTDSKKDPTAVTGDFGTTLPDSGDYSFEISVMNISTNHTSKVTLSAPKKGLMVSGTMVVPASGNDTTSATASVTFQHRRYYGVTTSATPTDIKSLASTGLVTSKGGTLTGVTANTSQYFCYAYPKSLGALSKITQNGAAPVLEDFNRTEVTIVNDAGLSIVYYVYTTKNKGAFTNVELKFE